MLCGISLPVGSRHYISESSSARLSSSWHIAVSTLMDNEEHVGSKDHRKRGRRAMLQRMLLPPSLAERQLFSPGIPANAWGSCASPLKLPYLQFLHSLHYCAKPSRTTSCFAAPRPMQRAAHDKPIRVNNASTRPKIILLVDLLRLRATRARAVSHITYRLSAPQVDG